MLSWGTRRCLIELEKLGRRVRKLLEHKRIKLAINGSRFEFEARIDDHYFTNHLTLLEHIEKELLPICDACRSYKFTIRFYSDYSSVPKVIEMILKFRPINACSNVFLKVFAFDYPPVPKALPIDAITNWVNQSCDYNKINQQAKKERILKILINAKISNVSGMQERLKEVN